MCGLMVALSGLIILGFSNTFPYFRLFRKQVKKGREDVGDDFDANPDDGEEWRRLVGLLRRRQEVCRRLGRLDRQQVAEGDRRRQWRG